MPTKLLLSTLNIVFCISLAQAQVPFACDGSAYLVISPDDLTKVYRVNSDLASGAVTYDLLSETPGIELNAIGFRKTDNLIYGINRLDNSLHRIDATGNIEFVTFPPFPTDASYIAGDISPDGNSLVLLTTVNAVPVLRYINLADGLYTVTDKELLTLNGDPLFCTDIAFEPNTELVYGYDASSDRLAIINPLSGIADNTFFPQNDVVANTPSLFFDSFGNLFGLGAGDLQTTDVNLFKFNINTGEAELFAPAEDLNGNSDGCSCPFNLALNQSFNPSTTFSCTRTRLTIRLANLTSSILNNANLSETLDPAFSVEEFIYNPFGGTIESMLGTNEIEISGLNIPIGVDSIVVMVDVGDAPVGLYQQQASLDIINPNLGTIDTTIVSDNPFTPIPNDSSTLEIVPLSVDLSDNPTIFCVGDELVLRATAGLGLEYEWNDDSTAPQLLVDRPDLYSVTVSTACEVASDSINIEQAVIEIDLGEDMSITLGDEVQLNPSIFAFGELVEYIWYQGSPPELIDCPNCTSYSETPLASTSYTLLLRDEYDCEAEDTKNVEVLKDYDLFAPNAFSPNRDGQNDFFYLQTKEVLIIEEFRVFDRWGGLVFEVKDRMTNLPSDGWNGLTGGQAAPEGLYVWTAEVKWIDGVVQAYAGEILLLH